MAVVTYFPGQPPISGSIGGTTFQSNGIVSITRSKPWYPKYSTPKQKIYQELFKYLVAQWKALEQWQRDTWIDMMSIHKHDTIWGESHAPTGYQWFMSCGINNSLCGFSVTPVAEAWWIPPNIAQFGVNAGSDTLELTFSPPQSYNYYGHLIYATPPLRHTVADLRSRNYIIMKDKTQNFSSLDIKSAYETSFGVSWADVFNSGKFSIMFRVRQIDSESSTSSFWTNFLYSK